MMLMILLWCNDANGDGDDDDYDVTQLCACRSMRWSRDPCWSRVKAFAHCVPISHDIPIQWYIIISHCILISSQSSRKNGKSKLIFTGSSFHKSFGFLSRPMSRISGKLIFHGIQVPGPRTTITASVVSQWFGLHEPESTLKAPASLDASGWYWCMKGDLKIWWLALRGFLSSLPSLSMS